MVKINCWKMKFLLLMQAPLIFRDELAVLFQGRYVYNIINIWVWVWLEEQICVEGFGVKRGLFPKRTLIVGI